MLQLPFLFFLRILSFLAILTFFSKNCEKKVRNVRFRYARYKLTIVSCQIYQIVTMKVFIFYSVAEKKKMKTQNSEKKVRLASFDFFSLNCEIKRELWDKNLYHGENDIFQRNTVCKCIIGLMHMQHWGHCVHIQWSDAARTHLLVKAVLLHRRTWWSYSLYRWGAAVSDPDTPHFQSAAEEPEETTQTSQLSL